MAEKYVTSKLESGTMTEATKEQLMDVIQLANYNRVMTTSNIMMRLANRFGDEVWDELVKADYAVGLMRSEIQWERIKACGDDKYMPDPRVIRKQIRIMAGAIGIASSGNEVMEGDPSTGKFTLKYIIDRCPFDMVWREMGLPSEIRCKLCSAMGWASDIAGLEYYGIWLWEDQGLAQGKPYCSFIMSGPKSAKEHAAWGANLPDDLKKYYHPWPWCK